MEANLWCALCNLSVCGKINMIAHLTGKKHLAELKETSISESVIPAGAKLPHTSSAQSVVQTRWTCELCETTFYSDLTSLRGKKHRAKTELWCDLCKLSLSCETNMIAHLEGKKHLTKLKKTFTDP